MSKGNGGTRAVGGQNQAASANKTGPVQIKRNETFADVLHRIISRDVDTEGLSSISLNAKPKDVIIENITDKSISIKYRYDGYDNPLTHPYLRGKNKEGWMHLRFDRDEDGWYIEEF